MTRSKPTPPPPGMSAAQRRDRYLDQLRRLQPDSPPRPQRPAAAPREDALIRFFDVVLALIGIALAAPVLLLTAVVIKIEDGGPVLYTQRRLGQYLQPFVLIKFRTMRVDAEAAGPSWSSSADPRITRVGRLLRRLRCDELPQLLNILSGDMSFVGPRPIRRHFADLLGARDVNYWRRFLVKPGLTGWAQLYAPYGATVDEQLEKIPYDLRYCDRPLTVSTYLKLIALTAVDVVAAKGV